MVDDVRDCYAGDWRRSRCRHGDHHWNERGRGDDARRPNRKRVLHCGARRGQCGTAEGKPRRRVDRQPGNHIPIQPARRPTALFSDLHRNERLNANDGEPATFVVFERE